MNRVGLILFIVAASLLYFYAILRDQPQGKSLVGKPAPGFSVGSEQGATVQLNDLRGKVILVHFWATWCAPCAEELPTMDDLVRHFPSDDFVLLAISVDEEGEKAVAEFRKKVSFQFPVYFDANQKVVDSYGTYKLPESYLVNRQGVVVRKMVGPQDWSSPVWIGEIKQLLNVHGKPDKSSPPRAKGWSGDPVWDIASRELTEK